MFNVDDLISRVHPKWLGLWPISVDKLSFLVCHQVGYPGEDTEFFLYGRAIHVLTEDQVSRQIVQWSSSVKKMKILDKLGRSDSSL